MDYLPGWDLIFVLRRFENHKLFGFIAALSAKIVVIEAIHKLRYIHRTSSLRTISLARPPIAS